MKLLKAKNVKTLLFSLIKQIELYSLRSKTRKQLLDLDEHLLKDMGLTRQQAVQEARLYFWQGEIILNDSLAKKSLVKNEFLPGENSI